MTAGTTAAIVAAAVVVPFADRTPIAVDSAAIALSAALSPLLQSNPTAAAAPTPAAAAAVTASATSAGDAIINAYNALQPWVAYGFELADWALSFVPGVWWISPAIDLAYFTAQPIVQSLVYSFAYLIDGQPSLIGPTLSDGITQAATNFVTYSLEWLYSIVPLPPIPPFPSLPFASVANPTAASRSVGPRAARTVVRVAAAPATESTPEATPEPTSEPTPEAPDVAQAIGDSPVTQAVPVTQEDPIAQTAPVAVTPTRAARQAGRSAVRAVRTEAALRAPAAASTASGGAADKAGYAAARPHSRGQ